MDWAILYSMPIAKPMQGYRDISSCHAMPSSNRSSNSVCPDRIQYWKPPCGQGSASQLLTRDDRSTGSCATVWQLLEGPKSSVRLAFAEESRMQRGDRWPSLRQRWQKRSDTNCASASFRRSLCSPSGASTFLTLRCAVPSLSVRSVGMIPWALGVIIEFAPGRRHPPQARPADAPPRL
jgi:hypothetical protein